MVYRFLTYIIATHAGMVSSGRSKKPYDSPSTLTGMLFYHSFESAASAPDLFPIIIGAGILDQ